MKKFFILSAIAFSNFSFAQKVDLKKGKILVDGKEWGNYTGCTMFSSECTLNIGSEEISVQTHSIKDMNEVSRYNKDGSIGWDEVKFLGKKKSFEIQGSNTALVKELYKAQVVGADGKFNDEGIDRIIEKFGKEFSDKYYKSSNSTVIINNNEPQKSNGINIHIGR